MMSESFEKAILPNFTNEASEEAESKLDKILNCAQMLGVTVEKAWSSEKLLEMMKQDAPERLKLVISKLQQEGLKLGDLDDNVLQDRLLGVDKVFKYGNKIFAVDVTTGKHTVVKNKVRKLRAMQPTLQSMGVDKAVVLRLKDKVSDDLILDIFGRLEEESEDFCITLRYPETKK